jgi:hypothetical protein
MTPYCPPSAFLDFVAARYPEVAMSLSYDVEFWAVGWLPGPAAGVLASGGHA